MRGWLFLPSILKTRKTRRASMTVQRSFSESVKNGLVTGCALLALATSPMVSSVALAESGSGAGMQGQNPGGDGGAGGGNAGGPGGGAGGVGGGGLNEIFRAITGMGSGQQSVDPVAPSAGEGKSKRPANAGAPTAGAGGTSKRPVSTTEAEDDSDRPEWAGQPGGKDGVGGGSPTIPARKRAIFLAISGSFCAMRTEFQSCPPKVLFSRWMQKAI